MDRRCIRLDSNRSVCDYALYIQHLIHTIPCKGLHISDWNRTLHLYNLNLPDILAYKKVVHQCSQSSMNILLVRASYDTRYLVHKGKAGKDFF